MSNIFDQNLTGYIYQQKPIGHMFEKMNDFSYNMAINNGTLPIIDLFGGR